MSAMEMRAKAALTPMLLSNCLF